MALTLLTVVLLKVTPHISRRLSCSTIGFNGHVYFHGVVVEALERRPRGVYFVEYFVSKSGVISAMTFYLVLGRSRSLSRCGGTTVRVFWKHSRQGVGYIVWHGRTAPKDALSFAGHVGYTQNTNDVRRGVGGLRMAEKDAGGGGRAKGIDQYLLPFFFDG